MDSEQGATRRQALRNLGLGVGALSVGTATFTLQSLLPAAAQETTTTTEGKDEGLTEEELLAFLESLELSSVGAYERALTSSLVSADATVLTQNQDHHRQHAQVLAGLAGASAEHRDNAKLSQIFNDQLREAHTEKAVLKVLADLEGAMAATHLSSLASLTVDAHEQAVASILPIESQHAVVMGQLLGRTGADLVPPFEIVDRAIPADTFPLKEKKK